MNIVFVSNAITPHQIPVCDELSKLENVSVKFIESINIDKNTLPIGWQTSCRRDYVVSFDFLSRNREAIIEEIEEELGIDINEDEVKLFKTYKYDDAFKDVFYIKKDIDINSLTYQEDEVEYVKYLTKDEILDLINNNGNIRKTNIDAFLDIIKRL